MVTVPYQESDEITERHEDNLFTGISGSSAFGDNKSDTSVVVAAFNLSFIEPGTSHEPPSVLLAFDDHALTHVTEASNIAFVRCGADAPVDPVIDRVTEIVRH